MKKLSIAGLFLIIVMSAFAPSDEKGNQTNFQAGEKIVYKLFYNWNFVWLSAGEVTFEVKDEGEEYHIEVTGVTYSSYEWFYRVRDKYHSYINKETLLPRLYIRDINQGTYKHYEKIVFDQAGGKANSYTGKTLNNLTKKEIQFNGPMYDMVSVMYLLRNLKSQQFKAQKKIPFNILLDHEKYELALNYLKDEKKFSVKEMGKFNVLNCKASAVSGHVFKEDAMMSIFIGDDSNNLPVLIESPLSVGSVKAVLKSQQNLKFPLSSKI
ncbi:MAG TPA: DUF3108 domain-containing protein [Saprospiraceae bacterium]|jgi:hypothetical protein|nr:DUF3108 domain-containing protein [Saprospiraceae bacterium]HUN15214.1 DUF3108 domain-containing protein [Saprospiraceae bacterium]